MRTHAIAAVLALAPVLALAQQRAAEIPLPPPPAGAQAGGRPAHRPAHRLAVLDFSLAGSAHPDLARVLADAASVGAAASPEYQVLSQGEVVALLGLERTRQMLGCSDDQGCMTELAGALDSDRLLSGSLTILDRTALLSVKLIDVKKSRTLARVSGTLLDASEKELVDGARRLAHEAITGKKLDTSGQLRVTVDRPGAIVTVDGKALGESPIKETPRVLEGPHAITVQKPGFVRWSSTVVVTAGQTVPVEVDLIPIQLLGEAARSRLWTWGWVTTGVAGAAAVSGAYFGAQSKSSHDQYLKATTRSEAVDLHDKTQQQALISNVSWGVSAVAAVGAGWLLWSALVEDARATLPSEARPTGKPVAAAVPVEGGAMVLVGGRF
jgi:hypothetical protein